MNKREQSKVNKRHEIIQIALELFEKQGFDETTAQEIAEKCHISKKTFFQYFPKKVDIVFDDEFGLLDEIIAELKKSKLSSDVWDNFQTVLPQLQQGQQALSNTINLPKIVNQSEVLQDRLLRMWQEYEIKLKTFLLEYRFFDEALDADITARQMVMVLRLSFEYETSGAVIIDRLRIK